MSKENGGQAFPRDSKSYDGMTLRDYFAGQWLAGMWANDNYNESSWDSMAESAYKSADAMLEARKK